MILTNDPSLSLQSQRIESDLEAFLARGGEIEAIPVGAMAETGWTARQRCNPQVHTQAMRQVEDQERAARTLAKRSEPAPRGSERNPPTTVAKVPRVHNGPRIARPGTQKARMLELLAQGPMRTVDIAKAVGTGRNSTCVSLTAMREAGLVVSTGGKANMRWAKA